MARSCCSPRFALLALLALAHVLPGYAAEPPTLLLDRAPALTLSFVGDIMHHRLNASMPDYDRLYDSVRRLLQVDDLSFANIEFPVDPERPPDGYPFFNGSVGYVEAAIRGGFDVFAVANNHTWDLGLSGALATARVMDDLSRRTSLATNGIRRAPGEPIRITEIVIRGWRVGFVSVTSFSNMPGSSRHIHLVNYFDDRIRDAFLAQVSEWSRAYDLLVVGVHAGDEYVQEPAPAKAEFLRALSDAGAHIVWAHHPHVLQPWERRNGGIIMHSTGNFVSAQRRHQSPWVPVGRWAPTGDTAIYQVRVEDSEAGPVVTTVRTPLFTMYNHPVHGLVLRSFDEVLAERLTGPWRAFYLARYAATRRYLRDITAHRVRGNCSIPGC